MKILYNNKNTRQTRMLNNIIKIQFQTSYVNTFLLRSNDSRYCQLLIK